MSAAMTFEGTIRLVRRLLCSTYCISQPLYLYRGDITLPTFEVVPTTPSLQEPVGWLVIDARNPAQPVWAKFSCEIDARQVAARLCFESEMGLLDNENDDASLDEATDHYRPSTESLLSAR